MGLSTYRELEAWKRGMALAELCYRVTSAFPRSEIYGITAQIRRAAVSIPANVAEGYCRRSIRAYVNHVGIALGSHGELETLLELAVRLRFLTDSQPATSTCAEVGRLLSGLHRSLDAKLRSPLPSP